MDESGKQYAKGKNPDTKGHTVELHLYAIFRIGKHIETESILVVARDGESGEQGGTA